MGLTIGLQQWASVAVVKYLREALKLKLVLVRRVSAGDDPTKPAIISRQDVPLILRERIKKAGGITSWSKLVGVDRSHLSKVLHNVRTFVQRQKIASAAAVRLNADFWHK